MVCKLSTSHRSKYNTLRKEEKDKSRPQNGWDESVIRSEREWLCGALNKV